MLKVAFNRGEICLAAPFGHIVWVDDDIAYDVEGCSTVEYIYLIPIAYLDNNIEDFMYVPEKTSKLTKERCLEIILKYCKDNNIDEPENIELCKKFLRLGGGK